MTEKEKELEERIACLNEDIGIKNKDITYLKERIQKAEDWAYRMQKENAEAKKIIKNLLSAYITYADSFDDRDNEIVEDAEAFLKE